MFENLVEKCGEECWGVGEVKRDEGRGVGEGLGGVGEVWGKV